MTAETSRTSPETETAGAAEAPLEAPSDEARPAPIV